MRKKSADPSTPALRAYAQGERVLENFDFALRAYAKGERV
jgi:hypothetical protein